MNISDYFCWSIQRLFERGETRYYNFLKDKISLVVDLYDAENYANSGNYYTVKKPLTNSEQAKIKNARDCTKKDTLQRLGVGFHAA